MTTRPSRRPRYSQPLPRGSTSTIQIARKWDELQFDRRIESDPDLLRILEKHDFSDLRVPVPLQLRYTPGRRWTDEEFRECRKAWESGISLTLIAASLNRNPQDMIYRLLDYCGQNGLEFTQKGRSEGSANWTPKVAACAQELFAAGLPAWKIASLFRVDFEHVEKELFLRRIDYGHKKQNPFAINTSHKYITNKRVLETSTLKVNEALDAFAGEGKTTRIINSYFPAASILAVETNAETFLRAQESCWPSRVTWVHDDNRKVLIDCQSSNRRFDLIDLDPFVSCAEQLPLIWELLNEDSLLFLTFGGEYRRSFITTNRKAIATRYGFNDPTSGNSDYLEEVPYFFLGWVAKQASDHSYSFDVLRAVRYANNCRFWLRTRLDSSAENWKRKHVVAERGGFKFQGFRLPRFAEVRKDLYSESQKSLFE